MSMAWIIPAAVGLWKFLRGAGRVIDDLIPPDAATISANINAKKAAQRAKKAAERRAKKTQRAEKAAERRAKRTAQRAEKAGQRRAKLAQREKEAQVR